jgi:hypothetical protein|tara:strand:+ start:2933 stop:4444 length:1512 start_codon:yes stop_codon:yes gene_type:complete
MKDKVLQRKMFREKALKKYGGDMLPKYKTGDLNVGEEPQGILDSGIASIREVFPNFLNVTGENNTADTGAPYDSKKAMVLAIAGQLLQAQQRPGEGMFAGVGRGVGRAITEDFPKIQKLDLTARATAAAKKTSAVNKTKVWDTKKGSEGGFDQVSFDAIEEDRLRAEEFNTPRRFIIGENENYYISKDSEYGDKGDPITLNPQRQREIRQKIGNEEFEKLFSPVVPVDVAAVGMAERKEREHKSWLKGESQYYDSMKNMDTFRKLSNQSQKLLLKDRAEGGGAYTNFKNFISASIAEVDKVVKDTNPKQYQQSLNDRRELLQLLQTGTAEQIMKYQIGDNYIFKDVAGVKRLMQQTKNNAVLQSLFVDLAYMKAKAREPGGRFSVTDIELAMKTIGQIGDPQKAAFTLNQAYQNTLNEGFSGYINHLNRDPYKNYEKVSKTGIGKDRFDLLFKSGYYAPKVKGYEDIINDYLRFNNYSFRVGEAGDPNNPNNVPNSNNPDPFR